MLCLWLRVRAKQRCCCSYGCCSYSPSWRVVMLCQMLWQSISSSSSQICPCSLTVSLTFAPTSFPPSFWNQIIHIQFTHWLIQSLTDECSANNMLLGRLSDWEFAHFPVPGTNDPGAKSPFHCLNCLPSRGNAVCPYISADRRQATIFVPRLLSYALM